MFVPASRVCGYPAAGRTSACCDSTSKVELRFSLGWRSGKDADRPDLLETTTLEEGNWYDQSLGVDEC